MMQTKCWISDSFKETVQKNWFVEMIRNSSNNIGIFYSWGLNQRFYNN